MFVRCISLLACLALAACIVPPLQDTGQVLPGAFGSWDNDTGAINQASWAFAVAERTRNDPVDAARAIAAVDYLAGELSGNARWFALSQVTKQQMLQARVDVRRVVGIAPNAPSQIVVDALLQFAAAWQFGNQPAALEALAAPAFTLPPDQTLRILANLPYIQSANLATMYAAQAMFADSSIMPR